ncbi:MAG: Hsp20/alpha crystallin family protein [Desulfovermiculus sp.]
MLRKYLPELRRRSQQVQRPQNLFDMMESFFNEPFERMPFAEPSYPQVNVSEDEKQVTVTAELPGMKSEDIDITIRQDHLILQGEKRFEDEEKDKNFHRIECSYGSFYRTVPLPGEVDADKVKAKFKDGILTVNMPKTASTQHRKIEIES